METIYKILTADDADNFTGLVKIFKEVFEIGNKDLPSQHHFAQLLANNSFIAMAATVNNEVFGGLTAYVLQSYHSEKPTVYLYDIAVKKIHQRKGIGSKLVKMLIEYCAEKNYSNAFVQAEADDEEAISFYQKTAYTESIHAVQFTYSLQK
jgi:aminoglycoside 3-N-acetyltransferase I